VLGHRFYDSGAGVVQSDPHEAVAALRGLLEGGLELDPPAAALAILVQAAVDDRRSDLLGTQRPDRRLV